jgi:hypothetical protein
MPRGDHTDYSKGYVYMMKCLTTGRIYIGSSCDNIDVRFGKHQSGAMYNRPCSSRLLFETGGEVTIEVIEYCPCDGEEEINVCEAYYIKLFKDGCGELCVNQLIPGRSAAQHYQDNRDVYRKKRREYYERTRDVCIKRASARYERHKDQIDAYKKEWHMKRPLLICPCGGRYKQHSAHVNTKIHLKYLANQQPN